MQGKAFVFGDNIDTDNIFPTRFGGDATTEQMAKHIFFDFRPGFSDEIKKGDFITAGYNFGCGSYRETAAAGISALGVPLIIARSFARAFYRNAVNNGIWLITLPDLEFKCQEGNVLKADVESGLVINQTTGQQAKGKPLSGIAREIVQAGGATKFFKSKVIYPEI